MNKKKKNGHDGVTARVKRRRDEAEDTIDENEDVDKMVGINDGADIRPTIYGKPRFHPTSSL